MHFTSRLLEVAFFKARWHEKQRGSGEAAPSHYRTAPLPITPRQAAESSDNSCTIADPGMEWGLVGLYHHKMRLCGILSRLPTYRCLHPNPPRMPWCMMGGFFPEQTYLGNIARFFSVVLSTAFDRVFIISKLSASRFTEDNFRWCGPHKYCPWTKLTAHS